MRYCVTGATGFLGGDVARQLVAAGHHVVAVVRTPAKATALADLGVSIHHGDVTDKESLRAPMTGGRWRLPHRRVVQDRRPRHIARHGGQRRRHAPYARDDARTRHPQGVYTSTYAVNSDTHGQVVDESYRYAGPFLTVYERTKWLAHYEVAAPMITEGLPLVIVTPGVIYGPGDTSGFRRMWIDYLKHKLPIIPRGCVHRWGHIEDTARAHLFAMDRGRRDSPTSSPGRLTPWPRRRPWPTGSRACHGRARSCRGRCALARVAGVVEKVLPVPANYRAETLRSLPGATYLATSAKAQRAWGYAPRSLEEGLPDTLRHEMRLLGMAPPADG